MEEKQKKYEFRSGEIELLYKVVAEFKADFIELRGVIEEYWKKSPSGDKVPGYFIGPFLDMLAEDCEDIIDFHIYRYDYVTCFNNLDAAFSLGKKDEIRNSIQRRIKNYRDAIEKCDKIAQCKVVQEESGEEKVLKIIEEIEGKKEASIKWKFWKSK